MTDVKTLRLASLQLSPERLEAFVTYQRTMLHQLAVAPPGEWSGRYAFAHGRALAASKLDLVDLGKLKSMVADFCGKRSSLAQIRERIARAPAEPDAKEAQLLAKARGELPRLEDLSAFRHRHGEEATALLLDREAELVSLHRELAQREGAGHLHPG